MELLTHKPTAKEVKWIQYPYFSPYLHSWEIDIVFVNKQRGFVSEAEAEHDNQLRQRGIGLTPPGQFYPMYLFCININTKFLDVYGLKSKRTDDVISVLSRFIIEQTVRHIRGDREGAFISREVNHFLHQHHITTYWTSHPFTNHNRVVDRVIRTFRAYFRYHESDLQDYDNLLRLVRAYNNTPHSAYNRLFTPEEVERNIDIEGAYIRHEKQVLLTAEFRQARLGIRGYNLGNVVLLHMDLARTGERFAPLNLYFNGIGIFLEYHARNALVYCLVTGAFRKTAIVISTSYTRFVCPHFFEIPPDYAQHFGIPLTMTVYNEIRDDIDTRYHIQLPSLQAEDAPLLQPEPQDPLLLARDAVSHPDNTRSEIERRRQDELQTLGTLAPLAPAPPVTDSQEAEYYADMEQRLHPPPVIVIDDAPLPARIQSSRKKKRKKGKKQRPRKVTPIVSEDEFDSGSDVMEVPAPPELILRSQRRYKR
jgi:hypothetical protein